MSKKYPYLGKFKDGKTVLFTEKGKGVILFLNTTEYFYEDKFTPVEGADLTEQIKNSIRVCSSTARASAS
jgi:hypothetical protein